MITAFDVYLVMQLDSIRDVLLFFAIIGIVTGGVGEVCRRAAKVADDPAHEQFSIAPKVLIAGLACITLKAVLPDSKTAAAMIVIPAITSDAVVEQVTPEAKELYELAKDAMRELAKPKDK